jgi:thioredoxin 1
MEVLEITENEFDEKIKNNKVLVDCYAPWCGPCRALSPIIDEIAEENENVTFYKLNVDNANNVARQFGIMSIPTILVFENGELKNKSVGFKGKEQIEEMIK